MTATTTTQSYVNAVCPVLKPYASGGGARLVKTGDANSVGQAVQSQGPLNQTATDFAVAGGQAYGWRARQDGGNDWTLTVYAICVP